MPPSYPSSWTQSDARWNLKAARAQTHIEEVRRLVAEYEARGPWTVMPDAERCWVLRLRPKVPGPGGLPEGESQQLARRLPRRPQEQVARPLSRPKRRRRERLQLRRRVPARTRLGRGRHCLPNWYVLEALLLLPARNGAASSLFYSPVRTGFAGAGCCRRGRCQRLPGPG
jgi:hypothetical protein